MSIEWSRDVETYTTWAREQLPIRAPHPFMGDGSTFHLQWSDRRAQVTKFRLTARASGRQLVIHGDTWDRSEDGVWDIDVLEIEGVEP